MNQCGSKTSSNMDCHRPSGGCSGSSPPKHDMMHRRGITEGCYPRALMTMEVPDFKAKAVLPDGSFAEISLSQYRGKYVLLYFYPLDFTFVCPSEIVAFSRMTEEFSKKNVQLLACSIDSHFCHAAWRKLPLAQGGVDSIKHPMISDVNKSIARMFGVLLENEGVALRGLFLIDKAGVLRHSLINDLPLGRSVDEAMRMVDALQFHELHGEVCPANWKAGQKAMQPTQQGVANYLKQM